MSSASALGLPPGTPRWLLLAGGATVCVAMLIGLSALRWQLLGQGYLPWVLLVGLGACSVVIPFRLWPLRPAFADPRHFRSAVAFTVIALLGMAFLGFRVIDAGLDYHAPTVIKTRIYDKRVRRGKSSTFEVRVGSGRARPSFYEIQVSPRQYQALGMDMPVTLTLHSGLLGVPWCGPVCLAFDSSRATDWERLADPSSPDGLSE